MSTIHDDKQTLAVISSIFVPGLGHIILGGKNKDQKKFGIKILILSIILAIVPSTLVDNILRSAFNEFLFYILYSKLGAQISSPIISLIPLLIIFIPPTVLWLWQVNNLISCISKQSKKRLC